MSLGEIAAEPIEFASSYVIAKRVPPESTPPRATELPAEFSDDANGRQRRALFHALLGRVRAVLGAAGYSRYLEICREHFRVWVLAQPL